MQTYDEYVEGLAKIRYPLPPPAHTAILYAIMRGSPIAEAELERTNEDAEGQSLYITFADGGLLRVWDDAQSCCEYRYMSTDDDLPSFVGAKLVGFDEAEGPDIEQTDEDDCYVGGGEHNTMFVRLHTTAGTITLVTHNQHNGYYGGFDLSSYWSKPNG